jgi:hypothetical protein
MTKQRSKRSVRMWGVVGKNGALVYTPFRDRVTANRFKFGVAHRGVVAVTVTYSLPKPKKAKRK